MTRRTGFRRDFEDLHGPRAWVDVEVIRHDDIRRGRIVTRMDNVGARLAIGGVGLLFAIIIGMALIAMVVVAGCMIAGAFDPAHLGPG